MVPCLYLNENADPDFKRMFEIHFPDVPRVSLAGWRDGRDAASSRPGDIEPSPVSSRPLISLGENHLA
jgi:hypothetical protein